MPRTDAQERQRIVSILEKREAVLEWPCHNSVLRAMVEDGSVVIVDWRDEWWCGSTHRCAVLRLETKREQ